MTQRQGYFMALLALLLVAVQSGQAAEQDTVQAVIPWDAEGRVFKVDTGTMMFIGALHGILYVESSRGDIHEAFVMCPVTQSIDLESGNTEAVAHCEITASSENVAYARMNCDGEVDSCEGTFTLISGAGKFEGISGEGTLRVRSPMDVLINDSAAGSEFSISTGLAIIKDLEYRIP